MEVLLIAVLVGVGFIVAYHTYGRWLGSKVFELAAGRVCPSHRLRDDRDYVPTAKGIIFGHHFTSIAATGPIVGPAIAVIWGWLPALLWVVFGSVLIGAVHDFGALVVSLRNNGQSVGDIAGKVINRRVRLLFFGVLFLALTIIIAIFGLVIAAVFAMYPETIFPVLVQIPLALAIGLWLHRKGVSIVIPSIIALLLMYASVIYGNVGWLGAFNQYMAELATITWVIILLGYSFAASVLPVWMLLQPRDYINALQLISSLALIVLGLIAAAMFGGAPAGEGAQRQPLEIAAPMVQWAPEGAPFIVPFLFITIACGAISGFHCLVSSGTSSKQLKQEPDARFIGYGSMLTEGFLATIVILACVAGLGLGVSVGNPDVLTGEAAWRAQYASWGEAEGLGATVGAFVGGAGNFLKSMGIPGYVATALIGVFVAAFAATTLDTATRLQRYVVQELSRALRGGDGDDHDSFHDEDAPPAGVNGTAGMNPLTWLGNKYVATGFAVVVAGVIAAMPAPAAEAWTWATAGGGGMILWPMFGALNQLLAGLAFLVIAFWLWRRAKPIAFLAIPLLFMLVMPAWALLYQLFWMAPGGGEGWLFSDQPNYALIVISLLTLFFQVWMIVEAALLWPRVRGVLESMQPAGAEPAPAMAPAEASGAEPTRVE